ncbi:protein Niban 3 isoform X3 [Strix aluco]|uniref:protein Niban 3 isoform X3 n=1 Tax=Strix aluco TaxID=111821 RepID=UPI003DA1F0C0
MRLYLNIYEATSWRGRDRNSNALGGGLWPVPAPPRPRMGGRCSSPLSGRQRRYLRGRADATVKNFVPHYRRQLAAALLRRVSGELEPPGSAAPQLLPSQLRGPPDAALHEGVLAHYDSDSRSWQENYFVLLGDFTLRWFDNEEALRKGCEPRGSAALSGYLLLSAAGEYAKWLGDLCQGLAGGSPFADAPGEFPLFLCHPFRRHFCFRAGSAGARRAWRAALGDALRCRGTELRRRDSLEAEAFLAAVRFYRQERGRYGAEDLLLGSEPEILGNVLMEDLVPVLRSQVLPSFGGSERSRQRRWLQFLQEVYTLVLDEISSEFEGFQEEKEKLRIELEKKIRPDVDQMLTLKEQIASELQAVVRSPAESCCARGVEPDLARALEELLRPLGAGVEAVRSLFARRAEEMVALARSSPVAVLQKELMQNCTHTFQQLSQQHLGRAAARRQLPQMLGKVKERVLKKFDYDSSSARERFAQEWLLRIFLPFLLKHLEAGCKLELPRYESFVFADFSGIINLENIYEETVLAVLQQAVGKGEGAASPRPEHPPSKYFQSPSRRCRVSADSGGFFEPLNSDFHVCTFKFLSRCCPRSVPESQGRMIFFLPVFFPSPPRWLEPLNLPLAKAGGKIISFYRRDVTGGLRRTGQLLWAG